jgi:hypothetical protein
MLGQACGIEPWRYRYYGCRARWNHDGRLRLVRADKLEEQFVALLGRLRASPKLIERHRRRSLTASPQLLERTLREQKAGLDELARKRDVAWELHAAGNVRAEDVQQRLDALNKERGEVQDRIVALQQDLAIAKAATNQQRDAEALIRRGAQIFRRANVEEQNRIARAVSIELGGLHVDAEQRLKPGPAA